MPFPTNDPRFPGCGRRASRQEDNEGAARGRNGIHLSTEPPMGRSPGRPEPSLRAPGTQFQIQAHAFQLQGVRGPQDVGGGDERSDQHHRSSPPTPPSQKPAHHWPPPTQRTGPGRRHLEGRGARRECGGPPCPPARLSACDQGARAPWAASPSLCKAPILTASPHLRNLRDPPGASTTAVHRPCLHVVWHGGGRKDQGPKGRRRPGRTRGHERGWEAREEAKVSWRWTVCWTQGPRALMPTGGAWSPPQALAGTPGPAGSISDVCRGAGGGDRCLLRILWLLGPQKVSV